MYNFLFLVSWTIPHYDNLKDHTEKCLSCLITVLLTSLTSGLPRGCLQLLGLTAAARRPSKQGSSGTQNHQRCKQASGCYQRFSLFLAIRDILSMNFLTVLLKSSLKHILYNYFTMFSKFHISLQYISTNRVKVCFMGISYVCNSGDSSTAFKIMWYTRGC